MRFTMTVDMDNAAFEEPHHELGEIIHRLAESLLMGKVDATEGSLKDTNGNRVGGWEIK